MEPAYISLIALVAGFMLDSWLGDPEKWPHPVVGFGKAISFFEKRMNRGSFRIQKGAFMALTLVLLTFAVTFLLDKLLKDISVYIELFFNVLIVYWCLAGKTLRKEVKLVFEALDISVEKGRKQLARIVGRDTQALTPQQIRTAALETLAENLSDGVVAPLFWYACLGIPGMLAYKMVNTLDSMIGYKNDRYLLFGRFAARLDDVLNYIPARLTALFMLIVSGKFGRLRFVLKNAGNHASPNSGYPEAALAAILDCRFGGPNYYFGTLVEKPFIGNNAREISTPDMKKSISVNYRTECLTVFIILVLLYFAKIV